MRTTYGCNVAGYSKELYWKGDVKSDKLWAK